MSSNSNCKSDESGRACPVPRGVCFILWVIWGTHRSDTSEELGVSLWLLTQRFSLHFKGACGTLYRRACGTWMVLVAKILHFFQ